MDETPQIRCGRRCRIPCQSWWRLQKYMQRSIRIHMTRCYCGLTSHCPLIPILCKEICMSANIWKEMLNFGEHQMCTDQAFWTHGNQIMVDARLLKQKVEKMNQIGWKVTFQSAWNVYLALFRALIFGTAHLLQNASRSKEAERQIMYRRISKLCNDQVFKVWLPLEWLLLCLWWS